MKVLWVSTSFPRWQGDVRSPFLVQAIQHIQRPEVQIDVLAMHVPGAKIREEWNGTGIWRPRYLPEALEVLGREGGGLPALWKKRPWARLAILPFVLRQTLAILQSARSCDVIHAQWTLSGMLAWLSAPIHRRPYIVTVHGSDIFQAARVPWIRALTRASLNRAACVIAVSHALARAVIALGVSPERVQVVPNGVDSAFFSPTQQTRQPVLLFVGSLSDSKGGDVLIRALPAVLQQYPECRLVMIGEGPLREEWQALSKALNVHEQIDWLGSQPAEAVRDWMRKSKTLILPSRQEGFGVVLLEAMACGLPVIGSDAGGIPDIITPETGTIFPSGQVDALQAAILAYLGNPPGLEEIVKNARRKVIEQFGWQKAADQIVAIYQSAHLHENS